ARGYGELGRSYTLYTTRKKMDKKWVKRLFIPLCVTVIAAILSIILVSEQHYGSPTSRALIETILIIMLPILPILYGLKLRDKIGSILMGILPFSVIFIIILIESLLSSNYTSGRAVRTISYWFILIVIAGLEGYFASKGKGSLIIAIGLLITWYLWFLSGIH
ncbi:MAG: hypothetical protein ACP5E9_09690, partial [Candidatus Methanospirareceae archaeon]